MSKDNVKEAAPTPAAQQQKEEPKGPPKRVIVKMLRKVQGINNNVGEVCGFSPEVAAKLLDKNRQGGACAEFIRNIH